MKNSIKRVALVAAAALTLGGLTGVAAHATSTTALSIKANTGDNGLAGIAGPANTIGIHVVVDNTAGADFVTVSGAGSVITSATTGTVASTGASAVLSATGDLTVTTPQAGTITISAYDQVSPGVYSSTATTTLSVTVNATGINNVYSAANSTVYAYTGDTTTAGSITSTSDAAFSVTGASVTAGAPVASFKVTQNDGNGTALSNGNAKAVTVSTTLGALQTTHGTTVGSYAAVLAGTLATSQFWLVADGRSGTATVTIAINGVTAKSYAVTFVSTTIASFSATVLHKQVAYGSTADYAAPTSSTSPTIVVVTKDSNGNDNSSASSVTATTSDATIATVSTGTYNSTAGGIGFVVSGVAAGTVTITLQDTAAALAKQTVTVNVSKNVISAISVALDASSYAPGDKATLNVTAKDSAGNPVADGTYSNVLATGGFTASQSITSDLSSTSLKFVSGVAALTFYAPSANFSLNATTGTSTSAFSSALTGAAAALTASATTSSAAADAAQAAIDAANEATDAANAAYDAANNAMDSADAATQAAQDAGTTAQSALDAVTQLSSDVQKLFSDLSAKVAALASAVAKIAKKVKA